MYRYDHSVRTSSHRDAARCAESRRVVFLSLSLISNYSLSLLRFPWLHTDRRTNRSAARYDCREVHLDLRCHSNCPHWLHRYDADLNARDVNDAVHYVIMAMVELMNDVIVVNDDDLKSSAVAVAAAAVVVVVAVV
jgi:hypothetical protein